MGSDRTTRNSPSHRTATGRDRPTDRLRNACKASTSFVREPRQSPGRLSDRWQASSPALQTSQRLAVSESTSYAIHCDYLQSYLHITAPCIKAMNPNKPAPTVAPRPTSCLPAAKPIPMARHKNELDNMRRNTLPLSSSRATSKALRSLPDSI
jgi:hypothetical protein